MKNKLLFAVLTLPFLASCSLVGNHGDNTRKNNPSAQKNSASCKATTVYKANGKKYLVLKDVTGYQADGMAELYKNKTQGSLTVGCDSFDMNGFTAAHRSLPLPTHVKITNKNNNQSVVVKVNDRGPASGKSLIQVTPAVANLLGTSSRFPVHIEAITTAKLAMSSRNNSLSASVKSTAYQANSTRALSDSSKKSKRLMPNKPIDRSGSDRYYIVVGTYPSQAEAFDRFVRVSSIGLSNAAMETRKLKGKTLHMVRLGPYYNQDEIDVSKDRLRNDGLVKFNIVKN